MARKPFVRFPDLATYIKDTGDTQVHIAEVVGTTQAHVSRIVTGLQIPRADLAARLARYAAIPLDSFVKTYLAKTKTRRRRKRVA